jgi:hypothetical protein
MIKIDSDTIKVLEAIHRPSEAITNVFHNLKYDKNFMDFYDNFLDKTVEVNLYDMVLEKKIDVVTWIKENKIDLEDRTFGTNIRERQNNVLFNEKSPFYNPVPKDRDLENLDLIVKKREHLLGYYNDNVKEWNSQIEDLIAILRTDKRIEVGKFLWDNKKRSGSFSIENKF